MNTPDSRSVAVSQMALLIGPVLAEEVYVVFDYCRPIMLSGVWNPEINAAAEEFLAAFDQEAITLAVALILHNEQSRILDTVITSIINRR
jgi:hypothetical protein